MKEKVSEFSFFIFFYSEGTIGDAKEEIKGQYINVWVNYIIYDCTLIDVN